MTSIINDIAAEFLNIDSLETQHSDALDFHSLPVWSLKRALLAAYQAGSESAIQQHRTTNHKGDSA